MATSKTYLLIVFLTFLTGLGTLNAQEKFWKDTISIAESYLHLPISAADIRFMAVDEIGNLYTVRRDNTITRFNENGDSTGFYRNVSNGPISAIDATNPLRIMVYYSLQSKVVLLDRMMAPSAELDLRRINLYSPPAVAYSADGNFWIYDPFGAQLRKVDENLTQVVASNDLRQQLKQNPKPIFMVERNRKLYVCDSSKGILVFDQFANYINTLPIKGLSHLQVIGSKLVYLQQDKLVSYNLNSFEEQSFPLPILKTDGFPREVLLARNRINFLYDSELVILDSSGF